MGCDAVGCKVPTKTKFCGPHYRLVPVKIKRTLARGGQEAQIEAIRAIAAKEHKVRKFNELYNPKGETS